MRLPAVPYTVLHIVSMRSRVCVRCALFDVCFFRFSLSHSSGADDGSGREKSISSHAFTPDSIIHRSHLKFSHFILSFVSTSFFFFCLVWPLFDFLFPPPNVTRQLIRSWWPFSMYTNTWLDYYIDIYWRPGRHLWGCDIKNRVGMKKSWMTDGYYHSKTCYLNIFL